MRVSSFLLLAPLIGGCYLTREIENEGIDAGISDTDTDTDTESETISDSDTDIDTGTDTDADSDSSGDIDSDTDTDTDTGTESDIDIDGGSGGDFDAGKCEYQWHTFFGNSDYDRAYSIAVDEDGNIFAVGLAGSSWSGPDGELPLHAHSQGEHGVDLLVMKLGPDGDYKWHTFYGADYTDRAYSIALDADRNLIVAGYSDGSWNGPDGQSPIDPHSIDDNYSEDIFVMKLGPDGDYKWHTFHGGTTSNRGFSLSIDYAGNLIIAGKSGGEWNGPDGQAPLHEYSGEGDVFVLKLNSDGQYQWHTLYGSGGFFSIDETFSVAVDGTGDIVVAGHSYDNWEGPDGQSPLHQNAVDDMFVLKLDSSGEYKWHTFYGGGYFPSPYEGHNYYYDGANSVAVDAAGNIYVTGYSEYYWGWVSADDPFNDHTESSDMFAARLDSNGNLKWHTFYGATFNSDDGYSIAVDVTGNLLVAGYSMYSWEGPEGQLPLNAHSDVGHGNVYVFRLGSGGGYGWHSFYGSQESFPEHFFLTTDKQRNIYVTGGSEVSWTGPDGQAPLHEHSGGEYSDIFVIKLTN
jgi:hypothetical protein